MPEQDLPSAGAPSIDRRAQETAYHLHSPTDGFVPTVSRRGPARAEAGAAGRPIRAVSPTARPALAPPNLSPGAAGTPTEQLRNANATKAVQAATFAVRTDGHGAYLAAELKVTKAKGGPAQELGPPPRERGRLASGADRTARRARSRQERKAVGLMAQTSSIQSKYRPAGESGSGSPGAGAAPKDSKRWREGVDTRLNRLETGTEHLQDEMEDLREENLDLVDQVNLSLADADEKSAPLLLLRIFLASLIGAGFRSSSSGLSVCGCAGAGVWSRCVRRWRRTWRSSRAGWRRPSPPSPAPSSPSSRCAHALPLRSWPVLSAGACCRLRGGPVHGV